MDLSNTVEALGSQFSSIDTLSRSGNFFLKLIYVFYP